MRARSSHIARLSLLVTQWLELHFSGPTMVLWNLKSIILSALLLGSNAAAEVCQLITKISYFLVKLAGDD